MKTMTRTQVAAATLIAAAVSGAASASTVSVQRTGFAGLGGSFQFWDSGDDRGSNPAQRGGNGGRFELQISSPSGDPIIGSGSVRTFCIELNESIGTGGYNNVDVFNGGGIVDTAPEDDNGFADKLSTNDVKALSWLYANYFDMVADDSATDVQIEAFQLSVWEIVNEEEGDDTDGRNTYGLTTGGSTDESGTFEMRGSYSGNKLSAITMAEGWLDALNGVDLAGQSILNGLTVFSKDGFQDQLTLIPLPAPVLMGLAGLGFAGIARRRMNKG